MEKRIDHMNKRELIVAYMLADRQSRIDSIGTALEFYPYNKGK